MNLNQVEHGQIIGLYKGGNSKVKISKILDCSRNTVIQNIQKYEERGNVVNLPRSGRPKKINNDHKKVLKKLLVKIIINQLK